MSAIGDYVHYTRAGYYGKKKTTSNRTPFWKDLNHSLAATHGQIWKEARKNNRKEIAQEMQTILNNIIKVGQGKDVEGLNSEQKALYAKAFRRALVMAQNVIGTRLRITKDLIVEGRSIQTVRRLSYKSGSYQSDTIDNLRDEVETTLIQIEDGLKKMELLSKKRKINIEAYRERYNEIINLAKQLPKKENEIKKMYKRIEGVDGESVTIQGAKNIEIVLQNKKDTSVGLIGQINSLAQEINGILDSMLALGQALEYFIPEALIQVSAQARKVGLQHLQERMSRELTTQTGAKGTKKAYWNITSKYGVNMEEILKDTKSSNITQNKQRFHATLNNSMDKSDVQIELKDGEMAYVSAKNIRNQVSDFGVHLVSGSPLLLLLQNWNDYDFVNHYLNLAFAQKQKNEEEPTESDWNKNLSLTHRVIKEAILLGALTQQGIMTIDGNIKNNPGFFVINERYGGKKDPIKVIDMYTLFQALNMNIDKYIKITGTEFEKGSLNFGNPSIEGYELAGKRITWILQKLHNNKIDVAITIDAARDNIIRNIPYKE